MVERITKIDINGQNAWRMLGTLQPPVTSDQNKIDRFFSLVWALIEIDPIRWLPKDFVEQLRFWSDECRKDGYISLADVYAWDYLMATVTPPPDAISA